MSEKGISAEQQAKAWRLENGVSPTAPSAGVWPLTNTTETFTFTLEPYWTDAKVTEYLGARLREVEGERDRAVKDKFDNIEKWIEQAGELRQDISDFIEKLRAAEAERDRLKEALRWAMTELSVATWNDIWNYYCCDFCMGRWADKENHVHEEYCPAGKFEAALK